MMTINDMYILKFIVYAQLNYRFKKVCIIMDCYIAFIYMLQIWAGAFVDY